MPRLTISHKGMVELFGECNRPHLDDTLRAWLRRLFSSIVCDKPHLEKK